MSEQPQRLRTQLAASVNQVKRNPEIQLVIKYLDYRMEENLQRLISCPADEVIELRAQARECKALIAFLKNPMPGASET